MPSAIATPSMTNCRAEERPSICNDEWSRAVADEYGFVISPKIASEYRDAKLLLQKLKDCNGSIRPGNVRQADKARSRLAAIFRSLEPPPPSKYGMYRRHRSDQPVAQDQFQQDQKRLSELAHKRRSKIGLTQEEVAEEAHRMARVDTLIYGAEGEARRRWANLEWQVRLAPVNRPRLQPRATKDLRPLRVLYGPPSAVAQDPEQAPIRSAMRSPPMTATSIRTTQNYGRRPSGLMKTASRLPTNPRFSTAIPTTIPIPRKGHRRLCRHNRRPIRRPGSTLLANEPYCASRQLHGYEFCHRCGRPRRHPHHRGVAGAHDVASVTISILFVVDRK